MKITLKQKTPDWYSHRKKFINASEVATITYLNPFQTLNQLIHDKLFGSVFITNKYVEHGIKTEPIARIFFNQKTGFNFQDCLFTDDKIKLFSASLDGYDDKQRIILEIKCPFVNENNTISNTWKQFVHNPNEETIPKYYWCQIQCQLYCSEARFAYFLVYLNSNEFYVTKVYLNQKYINQMIILSRAKRYDIMVQFSQLLSV